MLLVLCVSTVLAASAVPVASDATMQDQTIEEIAKVLNSDYVFPEIAKQMEQALRRALKEGRYDRVASSAEFASLLTRDLQTVSHDRHLHVNAAPVSLAPSAGAANHGPEPTAAWRNHGFERVERLPGNIGYLKLNGFEEGAEAEETASHAMNFLADTSALIFDLRENGGGSPEMIVFLASYLLDEPVHLNSFYNRRKDETSETWSKETVPGRRYGQEKPVYVLTSKYTFSAAEEFTYDLKNLERAVIVGETTGGGAHPVFPHRINAELMMSVPFARAINPITKTNWEGTGVKPDIETKASDALYAAQLDALAQIARSVTDPAKKAEVEDAVRQVKEKYAKY